MAWAAWLPCSYIVPAILTSNRLSTDYVVILPMGGYVESDSTDQIACNKSQSSINYANGKRAIFESKTKALIKCGLNILASDGLQFINGYLTWLYPFVRYCTNTNGSSRVFGVHNIEWLQLLFVSCHVDTQPMQLTIHYICRAWDCQRNA